MKTGGHIKPCKVGSVEEHNERRPEYVERMKTSKHPLNFYPTLALRPNYDCKNTQREEYQDKSTHKPLTVAQIFDNMIEVYQEHDKRHRRPPLKDRERLNKKSGKMETVAGWSPIREAVIITKHDTKPEDFDPVMEWFRQNGVEPMFLDLHFDEGHIDQDTGEFKCNHHAHLGLDFFDWNTGKTIKLGPKKMSELQTVLADALGMERGELKEVTNRDYMDIPEYREYAEALTQKKKEVDEVDAVLTEKHEQNQQFSDENARLRRENAALQTKNALGDAASAVGQSIAGMFGQSSKDKTIQQLQNTIASEPERTAAAVAIAKTEERQQVINEIKQAAQLHIGKDGNETAEQIGAAWRRNYDKVRSLEVDMQSMSAEHNAAIYRATKDAENKAEEAQKEAKLWKNRFLTVWPTAVKAIAAIVEKVNNTWQNLFTDKQVKDIDAAMHNARNQEERIIYAKDLMNLARPEFTRDEGDTAKQVEDIARNGLNVQKIKGIGY